MQIDTEITVDDHRAFVAAVCYPSRTLHVLGFAMKALAWLAIGLVVLVGARLWPVTAALEPVGSFALIGALLAAGMWYYRAIRRHVLPSRPGNAIGPHTYEITPQGLRITTGYTDSMTAWPAFVAVRETPQHLFLMVDNAIGHIVPKRSFASPELIDGFRSEVSARMRTGGSSPV